MKALVIGAGRIGSAFDQIKEKKWVNSHVGAYKKNRRIKKIAVCDKDLAALKRAADFWRLKDTFNDLNNALRQFSPDIVSLCTGAGANLKLIDEVSRQKSVKFLWIEKPFSDTLENASAQLAILKKNNIHFVTNYQRRFDGFFRYIKDNMEGLIGKPQKCAAFFSGGIVNSASHLVNLLIFYFGLPENSIPLGITMDGQSNYHGDFCIKFNGLNAYCFELNRQSSIISGGYSIFEIQIFGEKGRLDIRSLPFNEYSYDYYAAGRGRFKNINILRRKNIRLKFPRRYMENGLEALLSKADEKEVSDGEGAIETLKVFKQIEVIK